MCVCVCARVRAHASVHFAACSMWWGVCVYSAYRLIIPAAHICLCQFPQPPLLCRWMSSILITCGSELFLCVCVCAYVCSPCHYSDLLLCLGWYSVSLCNGCPYAAYVVMMPLACLDLVQSGVCVMVYIDLHTHSSVWRVICLAVAVTDVRRKTQWQIISL